jgi:MFS family permease
VYQSYYKDEILQDYSASSISWIGTVQACFLLWAGVIAGPIFDKGHAKALVVVGSFLVVFGLMMTSLATEYYQVFLAHGACVGLGAGMVFLPSVAIVATYFTTHRALALGVTAVGGSVGKSRDSPTSSSSIPQYIYDILTYTQAPSYIPLHSANS